MQINELEYVMKENLYTESPPHIKHIWFFPNAKSNSKKPKELNSSIRTEKTKIYTTFDKYVKMI
jgi:hypothetical protein